MLDESRWIISLPLFRVKFSSSRAWHSLDPPFCFGHRTEVWFRWTEVGEPRRNCILWTGRSQADLWPWLARWWPANSRMQTGSSIFRQKQRWKPATKAEKEVFLWGKRKFYWTFFGFIQTAVWATNIHFCVFRLVFILSKPYCSAPWDPLLRDAVGGCLPAPDPPRCH